MPREVVVGFDGEVSRFELLGRVSREKLYGRKRRVVVDQVEQECSTAMLTRDGNALIPQGCLAYLYVDDLYHVVERRDLQAVDAEREPVEEVSSTLNTEQPLDGPVPPERVLEIIATSVYQLAPEEVSETLRERLAQGEIFETRFAYRSGFDLWPAFLLQNDAGIFAIVGREAPLDFVEREVVAQETDDEEDPFGDDLDFSMM